MCFIKRIAVNICDSGTPLPVCAWVNHSLFEGNEPSKSVSCLIAMNSSEKHISEIYFSYFLYFMVIEQSVNYTDLMQGYFGLIVD